MVEQEQLTSWSTICKSLLAMPVRLTDVCMWQAFLDPSLRSEGVPAPQLAAMAEAAAACLQPRPADRRAQMAERSGSHDPASWGVADRHGQCSGFSSNTWVCKQVSSCLSLDPLYGEAGELHCSRSESGGCKARLSACGRSEHRPRMGNVVDSGRQ